MSNSSALATRPRKFAAAAALVTAALGTLVAMPHRAAADYQHLPASSPATWSYNGTLATLQARSDTATQDSDKAKAATSSAEKSYAAAQKALSDAQAKEKAATTAQTNAKAKLAGAKTNDDKAKAQAAYNQAIGARHAASDKVKALTGVVHDRYVEAKQTGSLAAKAADAAEVAKARISRLQYMYGSTPTTAFTKLRASYTFSGNGHRPDTSTWRLYNTSKTAQPKARDPRYIGVYKNNLEATSWGTIGSGTCLCAGSALPTTPYGRWEVRAKVNANPDHGVAILLWPNDRQGPQSGEIDLAEFDQPRTQANFALHYDAKNLQVQSHILGNFRQWHTYRVDWNSRGIAWYIDNNLFATVTDKAAIPTKPFHLVIQAGPNSSKSGKTSTTVAVSSVKVYAP